MNIIIWNCRGAGKSRLKSILSAYVRKHRVDIVILLETRISGPKAQNVIKKLGFKNFLVEEARGYAGGIWALWNQPNFTIHRLEQSHQVIHMKIEWNNKETFILSAVYASPQLDQRAILWEDLRNFSNSTRDPWLIAGDFNDIIGAHEKKGGAPVDQARCLSFAKAVDDCKLLDLGADGPYFTWKGPKFAHLDRVFKRLDRAMANGDWLARFDKATVKTLPRVYSDHNPLLIKLFSNRTRWEERPFRLFPPWLDHPSFKQLLSENWSHDLMSHINLQQLVPVLRNWNSNTFGIINQRKNTILRRLNGIQISLETRQCDFLEDLESVLRKELEEILSLEELLWFQKARTDWIKGGDRNTKYYHTLAISKRKRNRIETLRNEAGI
ncbi:uncharacterized protein LOC133311578 [Gastrolobium bilobum]|uniref:uncharacterized protein LOC133311578 n=1 Tax=Gastrolobium bilobum TaxID=150636 RepID=UPI002AB0E862|nr:uncharacterized protein LOC133311578 [Gastrolobium bilobum]